MEDVRKEFKLLYDMEPDEDILENEFIAMEGFYPTPIIADEVALAMIYKLTEKNKSRGFENGHE